MRLRLSNLFSRWKNSLSSLSGRPNYPLPPEVGRFSGKTWREFQPARLQKIYKKKRKIMSSAKTGIFI
ncbi:hypothetical protein F8M41_022977 [Gigaspora margarita]|uniref:Uncharacterized protein n=1 Tax=Gigaspora margarita TaxID=4874 RepID=A0A8H4B139_GIGMA|nr:hypothetical protein F8M41_022977 [Gigaspora margarita]